MSTIELKTQYGKLSVDVRMIKRVSADGNVTIVELQPILIVAEPVSEVRVKLGMSTGLIVNDYA